MLSGGLCHTACVIDTKENLMTQTAVLVWGEIPVSNLPRATDFYSKVFGFDVRLDESGPAPQAILGVGTTGIGAHLFEGKPATRGTGPVLHLAIPDKLEAAIERCKTAGGTVTSPPVTVPPGRFAYALDPDGNRLGLFEPK